MENYLVHVKYELDFNEGNKEVEDCNTLQPLRASISWMFLPHNHTLNWVDSNTLERMKFVVKVEVRMLLNWMKFEKN